MTLRTAGLGAIAVSLLLAAGCSPTTTGDDGGAPGSDAGTPDGATPDGATPNGDDGGPSQNSADSGPCCNFCPSDAGFGDGGCGIVVAPTQGQVGYSCRSGSECNPFGMGLCLDGHCTGPCASLAECPLSWSCAPLTDGGFAVCLCTPTSPSETCNGLDDNCNGQVDESEGPGLCATPETCTDGVCVCPPADACGAVCVDLDTDPSNCGNCGMVCDPGDVCQSGGCVCPTGSVCNNVCVDISSDPENCGGCNDRCPASQDCVGSTCVTPDLEWARWSLLSTPTFTAGGTTALPTVTDSVTGLTWTATPFENVVGSPQTLTWAAAASYCTGVNVCQGGTCQTSPPGHPVACGTDADCSNKLSAPWHLPTRAELLSIVDYTQYNPAVSTLAFPMVQAAPYWTSTPGAGGAGNPPASVWTVDLTSGYANVYQLPNDSSFQLLVLCVH